MTLLAAFKHCILSCSKQINRKKFMIYRLQQDILVVAFYYIVNESALFRSFSEESGKNVGGDFAIMDS